MLMLFLMLLPLMQPNRIQPAQVLLRMHLVKLSLVRL